jgi:hypothetical protein
MSCKPVSGIGEPDLGDSQLAVTLNVAKVKKYPKSGVASQFPGYFLKAWLRFLNLVLVHPGI